MRGEPFLPAVKVEGCALYERGAFSTCSQGGGLCLVWEGSLFYLRMGELHSSHFQLEWGIRNVGKQRVHQLAHGCDVFLAGRGKVSQCGGKQRDARSDQGGNVHSGVSGVGHPGMCSVRIHLQKRGARKRCEYK